MEVFLGGSQHLEALPGVCRAPVLQLGPGDVVLTRNANFPVAIDDKLRATVLERWVREEGYGKSGRESSMLFSVDK